MKAGAVCPSDSPKLSSEGNPIADRPRDNAERSSAIGSPATGPVFSLSRYVNRWKKTVFCAVDFFAAKSRCIRSFTRAAGKKRRRSGSIDRALGGRTVARRSAGPVWRATAMTTMIYERFAGWASGNGPGTVGGGGGGR